MMAAAASSQAATAPAPPAPPAQQQQPMGKVSSEDVFSILVATDQHLGFMEKDPGRKDDSFRSFEEILQIGLQHKVDFVLFGGDLFHDNKPSRPTVVRTMELMRKYTWNDRPVQFELLSNQRTNFPPIRFEGKDYSHPANFLDANINVGFPVFAIHGNHDDPSGEGGLCALDIFHSAGLLNYFGKQDKVDNVVISPILLKKGTTRLALYGLGSIRDERLYHTFESRKVKFEKVDSPDPWFNMLVVHQNRVKHGTQYLPESFLDEFLHLVVWGHEHECKPETDHNMGNDFYVLQPGSSVATSLSEGEAKQKHAFIIKVAGEKFKVDKYPLKSVRPFIMQETTLSDYPDLKADDMEGVKKFMATKVRDLIRDIKHKWSQDNPDRNANEMPLPLVRLKVEITGFTNFNVQQFGQQFVGAVANPQDILIFYRKRTPTRVRNNNGEEVVEDVDDEEGGYEDDIMNRMALRPVQLDATRVDDLVSKYLQEKKLEILGESELAESVRLYVEKEEKDAIKLMVDKSLETMKNTLMKTPDVIQEDGKLRRELERLKNDNERRFKEKKEGEDPVTQVSKGPAKRKRGGDDDEDDTPAYDDNEDNEDEKPKRSTKTASTRGRRGGSVAASSSSSGRGGGRIGLTLQQVKARAQDGYDDDDGDDDMDQDVPIKKTTTRKAPAASSSARGRSKAASSASASKKKRKALDDDDEEEQNIDDDVDEIEEIADEDDEPPPPPKKATKSTTASSKKTAVVDSQATLSQHSTGSARRIPDFMKKK